MAKGPTLDETRVIGCVGSAIAIMVTLFRLWIRIRRRNLWWDDASAFLAMIAIIVFMIGIVTFTTNPTTNPRSLKIAAYYMVDNGFYGVIWVSRASIFFTLLRLAYGRFRTILRWCIGAVGVTYAVLFAQVFWTCEGNPAWKDAPIAQCMLGKKVAIAQLITDCLFDSILVAAPIYLLRHMKNKRGLKIRLIAVFSSTIFTTAFSLAHAWAIIEDRGLMEFTLASVEVFVSLIVVNLTVIVSWIFRLNDDTTAESNAQINTFLKGRLSGQHSGVKSFKKTQQASTFNNVMPMTVMVGVQEHIETSYDITLKADITEEEDNGSKRTVHFPPASGPI
ncbi:hypothetical protein PM082_017314 [Marasmius tenuissimus]|nr:hypothetical protein PM082_017314 [Marasmius tenuissimus]